MADDTTTNEPQDEFDVPLDAPESGPLDSQAPAEGEQRPVELALTPELAELMRQEKLPPIKGETSEAAYTRLATHLQGKNRQLWTQVKDYRDIERSRSREMAELRGSLEPMLRDYYQRQHRAAIEEQEAQIPPKDTPEYQVWLQEEVLRRLDAAEQGQQQQALTAEQQEAERQVQEQLAAIDSTGYQKVAEGLGLVQGSQPDPDFAAAYDVYSESAVAAARSYWPEASDDQIQRFVALSQQLDIRRAEMNGADIRDVMKGRFNSLIDSLERRGIVTRKQAAAAKAGNVDVATAAGTNGQQQQQQPAKAQPQKSVVERMRTDAAAAQRRGPSAVPASARPTQLPGQLPDTADLDEDDFVEAALAGLLGSEEQRTMKHRKER